MRSLSTEVRIQELTNAARSILASLNLEAMEHSPMSMYAVVLEKLRGDGAGKTASSLATTIGVPTTAVQDALDMLERDGRVSNAAGTYTEVSGREDK